jgi:hypothetical protein
LIQPGRHRSASQARNAPEIGQASPSPWLKALAENKRLARPGESELTEPTCIQQVPAGKRE